MIGFLTKEFPHSKNFSRFFVTHERWDPSLVEDLIGLFIEEDTSSPLLEDEDIIKECHKI